MPKTDGGKIKILMVEDDKFLQKILSTKFAKDGFDVRLASDGEEGVKAIAADRPDIILLDLIMPKMSGFDVLAELGTGKIGPMPTVIVLSNLDQPEDIARAKRLGAADFMVKSDVSMNQIVQRVKEAYVGAKSPA